MKTIQELANKHNITYQGMSKKIKEQLKEQLDGCISTVNGKFVVNEIGEEVIANSFIKPVETSETVERNIKQIYETRLDLYKQQVVGCEKQIEQYKDVVEEYKELLATRDRQIESLLQQNAILIEQAGNSQKLLGVSLRVRDDSNEEPVKKGFFQRLFNRS